MCVCVYIYNIYIFIYLLKTALLISDFLHFHWLAGHGLSVHIPAVPIIVKECINDKAS